MKKIFIKMSFVLIACISLLLISNASKIKARYVIGTTVDEKLIEENMSYAKAYTDSISLYPNTSCSNSSGTVINYTDSYKEVVAKFSTRNWCKNYDDATKYGLNDYMHVMSNYFGNSVLVTDLIGGEIIGINDDDAIIQIVPKEYFVTEGTYYFCGQAYGFAIKTTSAYTGLNLSQYYEYYDKHLSLDDNIGEKGYISNVMLFEINYTDNHEKNTGKNMLSINPLSTMTYVSVKTGCYDIGTRAYIHSTDTFNYVVVPYFESSDFKACWLPSVQDDYITDINFGASLNNIYEENDGSNHEFYFTDVQINYEDEIVVEVEHNEVQDYLTVLDNGLCIIDTLCSDELAKLATKKIGQLMIKKGISGTEKAVSASRSLFTDKISVSNNSYSDCSYYYKSAWQQYLSYGYLIKDVCGYGYEYNNNKVSICKIPIRTEAKISFDTEYAVENSSNYTEPTKFSYAYSFNWCDGNGNLITTVEYANETNWFNNGNLYLNSEKTINCYSGNSYTYVVDMTSNNLYNLYAEGKNIAMSIARITDVSGSNNLTQVQLDSGYSFYGLIGERYIIQVVAKESQPVTFKFKSTNTDTYNGSGNVTVNYPTTYDKMSLSSNEELAEEYTKSLDLYTTSTSDLTGTVMEYVKEYNSSSKVANYDNKFLGHNIKNNNNTFLTTFISVSGDDPVVQIIPRKFFIEECTFAYVGKAYGFAINTYINDAGSYLISNVLIFDVVYSDNHNVNSGNENIRIEPVLNSMYITVSQGDKTSNLNWNILNSIDGYCIVPSLYGSKEYTGGGHAMVDSTNNISWLGLIKPNDYISNVEVSAKLENIYSANIGDKDYNYYYDNGLYFDGMSITFNDNPQIVCLPNATKDFYNGFSTASSVLGILGMIPGPFGAICSVASLGTGLFGSIGTFIPNQYEVLDYTYKNNTMEYTQAWQQAKYYGSVVRTIYGTGCLSDGSPCIIKANNKQSLSLDASYKAINSTKYSEPSRMRYALAFDWYDSYGNIICSIAAKSTDQTLFYDGEINNTNNRKITTTISKDASYTYAVNIEECDKNSFTVLGNVKMKIARIKSVSSSILLTSEQENTGKNIQVYVGEIYLIQIISNENQVITVNCDLPIPTIKIGCEVSVYLTGKTLNYFRFIPTKTQYYHFYTEGSYDTYMYLYDSNMNAISMNDDGGNACNSLITYQLYEGVTYYLAVRGYSNYTVGNCVFKVRGEDSGAQKITFNQSMSDNMYCTITSDQEIAFTFTATKAGTLYLSTYGDLDTNFKYRSNTASVVYNYDDTDDPCNSGEVCYDAEMKVSFDANESITIVLGAYSNGTTQLQYSFYLK